jgi:murein L,D-transpeptidase YcbB/YkuD
VLAADLLLPFYEERGCRRAWIEDGALLPRADVLVDALRHADEEGLVPGDYHLPAILALKKKLRQGKPSGGGADRRHDELDLLLTDAFFLYATHLTRGRVDPASIDADWHIEGREKDLPKLLATALAGDHLAQTLRELPPQDAQSRRLKEALAETRAVAAKGGWPLVPWGPTFRERDRGPRVRALRRRLAATGEAPEDAGPADLYTEALARAVRGFQVRHGLDPDGMVGKRTLSELNTPATMRARQLLVNLERRRWIPRSLGRRYVVVNIPDFRLTVVDDGAPALEMRVIAGKQARRTPFFSGPITSIVFNPSWSVPEKILIEDKLPLILEDRDYLRKNHLRVYRVRKNVWKEVSPADVDWAALDPEHFPYRLRQDPGPLNALGRVKFQIRNSYDIYLHDTPSRDLFSRAERTFSSGCIRVEKPLELAAYLLQPTKAWPPARIEAEIATGKSATILVPEPLPVYLLYWTAWVDASGTIQYREDVYGQDAALEAALRRPRGPAPAAGSRDADRKRP